MTARFYLTKPFHCDAASLLCQCAAHSEEAALRQPDVDPMSTRTKLAAKRNCIARAIQIKMFQQPLNIMTVATLPRFHGVL